ncbi:acetate--CoA ligase family protein [Candidatus Micrarchaeota archaeon]|nr:acetate--CoA ligase family protein [Candidatus Micrarchaeota archaeon]
MLLGYKETSFLLNKYGIKTGKQFNCTSLKQVLSNSKKLKPPWVLKIIAEGLLHKTEKKLIETDLHDESSLKKTFDRLNKNSKNMKNKSFLLQEQLHGVEVIIGAKRDNKFGNIVLFGSGGIFAELFKDTSLRLLPITRNNATEMIDSTKASVFFNKGFRGRKASKTAVIDLLLKTSKLMEKEKITEIDFNPVIVTKNQAFVVDAKVLK